jgi:hypothetical protein
MASCSTSMPYVFTSTSPLSYVTTNANNNFLLTCSLSVDNTQIGGAGIFASQIIPTTTSQATFGGSQNYTIPTGLSVGGALGVGGSVTSGGTLSSGGVGVDSFHPYSFGCGTLNFFSSSTGAVAGVSPTGIGLYCAGASGSILSLDSSGNLGLSGGLSVLGGASVIGLTYSDQIQTETGGTHSQVLPLIFSGSAVNNQANAHVEVVPLTFGSPSGQATGNFTKPFDSAPGCQITYSGAGLLPTSIPPIQVSVNATTFQAWGFPTYTAMMTCTGP